MFRTLGLTRENETNMSIAPKKPTIQSLDVIQIQTPCQMDWGLMTGDEQTCHCDHCSKNVYNISEMSQSEAISLINEKEGDICLRLFQRPDGTVVTADCPPVKKYYSNPEKKRWFQFSVPDGVGDDSCRSMCLNTLDRQEASTLLHSMVWRGFGYSNLQRHDGRDGPSSASTRRTDDGLKRHATHPGKNQIAE